MKFDLKDNVWYILYVEVLLVIFLFENGVGVVISECFKENGGRMFIIYEVEYIVEEFVEYFM